MVLRKLADHTGVGSSIHTLSQPQQFGDNLMTGNSINIILTALYMGYFGLVWFGWLDFFFFLSMRFNYKYRKISHLILFV